ncbi:MAG TPA: amidase [Gaiellaceae bacterium]|nr:amidase [Gaiellaceae bacterium]
MTDAARLPFSPAVELLGLLERKEIGSRELVDLYLARIESDNASLNLVVALAGDEARAAAAAVDDARARGQELGPLAGLPMTVKDAFEVAGMTATCGLPELANHVPDQDADAVGRLRLAGAIFLGKTNVPTGAANWQSYNPLYGISRNPWNPERTVGGSSGGSAGSVAAGFGALELGSDIAGSIRVPSHFCGVFGHKPSYGIVPVRGHIPPPPGGLYTVPLGVAGPIARSAADLELALDVLAGPGPIDSAGWRLELPPSRHERLADFRVGVWLGGGSYLVDDAYRRALREFLDDLVVAGARVLDVELPFDADEGYDLFLKTLFAIVGAPVPEEAEALLSLAPDDETGYANRIGKAMQTSLEEWFGLLDRRERLFRAFQAFFADCDVLLCPAAMVVAFPHDAADGDGPHSTQLARRLIVSGEPRPYFDNFMWPSIATCSNLPATVMPTGRLVDGIPVGVQIIGPHLEDRTPLRFARLVEGELGGFAVPPALSS